MSDHPSLAAALAAFQGEMPTVPKSKRATVPTKTGGGYSYTYADLAAVTEAAMPILARHGLAFTARPRSAEHGWELCGTLLHTSGETLDGVLPIRGNTPQEVGSSLTYMRRYLLGCLTGVVTDDDDDGAAAQKAATKPAREAEPPQTRRMSRPAPVEGDGITTAQTTALHVAFNSAGVTDRDARLGYCRQLVGRDISTSKDLTKAEASRVIDALKEDAMHTSYNTPVSSDPDDLDVAQ